MSAAGLLVAAGTVAVFIQPFGPAAASGSGWPGFGSPITLPASTIPQSATTSTTAPCANPKKGCAVSLTSPPPTPTTQPAAASPPPTTAPPPAPTVPAPARIATVNVPTVSSTVPAKPAKPKAKPKAAAPTAASGVYNEPMVLANGGWKGLSLKAATNLKVPILFGLAVALFVLIQALIDRRDPKVSRAPERGDEETVGFE